MAEVCNNCEKGKIIEACSDTPGRHFGYMSIYINNVPSVITSLANGHGACFQQVWSLTQFYSVDFSQLRIGINKCVFYKRTIKVCVSCC